MLPQRHGRPRGAKVEALCNVLGCPARWLDGLAKAVKAVWIPTWLQEFEKEAGYEVHKISTRHYLSGYCHGHSFGFRPGMVISKWISRLRGLAE